VLKVKSADPPLLLVPVLRGEVGRGVDPAVAGVWFPFATTPATSGWTANEPVNVTTVPVFTLMHLGEYARPMAPPKSMVTAVLVVSSVAVDSSQSFTDADDDPPVPPDEEPDPLVDDEVSAPEEETALDEDDEDEELPLAVVPVELDPQAMSVIIAAPHDAKIQAVRFIEEAPCTSERSTLVESAALRRLLGRRVGTCARARVARP